MAKLIKAYCVLALIISIWLWYLNKTAPNISIVFLGGFYFLLAIKEFLNRKKDDALFYIALSLLFTIFGIGMVIHH